MYLTYLFGESGDFISLELWTSIFTLCNLVILFFVMKKLLFKPVKKMIDSRQQEVDDMYANANQDKEAAAQMKTEYEEKLAKASEQSAEMLKDATRRAQKREEEILREAQEQAAQTLKRADDQIEMEKKRAMNDIKDEVSGMAMDIASAILTRDIKREEHSELIDSFIENLGDSHD